MKLLNPQSRLLIQGLGLLVFLTLTMTSIGQVDTELWRTYNNPAPEVTFEDLQNSFQEYWKDREYQKGKGYKQFKRWENDVKPRIYPSGDMSLPSSNYENYMEWLETQSAQRRSVGPAWTELGPQGRSAGFDSGNGRLNMVRFHPTDSSIMYVGAADGGLWKTTNSGVSWTTNTDFLGVIGVADLAIDPTNANNMYLATGDVEGDRRSIGVLKSTDGGATWNNTALIWSATDNQKITKLLMDPSDPDKMLVATNDGVFRTTDGWDSWDNYAPFIPLQDMEFKPSNTNIVYVSGESTVWRSTDNGITFTQVTSGLPSSDIVRIVLAVSAQDPSVVYALAGKESDSGFLGLYRSNNSGVSFATQSTSPNVLGFNVDGMDTGGQAFYDLALTAASDDADLVTVGGINQWQSEDGGVNWYMISHWFGEGGNPYIHADVHEISHNPDYPSIMITCCDGGLYRSNDYGETWSDISNNLAISQVNTVAQSATTQTRMFNGLQDIGTIETTDNVNWSVSQGGGGDGEDCFIDRTDDDYIVVTGTDGNHELSTNGGISWNPITTGIPAGSGNADFYSAIRQDPTLTDRYYAGGRPSFYRTDNNGTNWTQLGTPFGGTTIKEFVVAPSDNTVIYATSSGALGKSTNGGTSWTDVTGTLPVGFASITKIAVSNTDEDKVWVCFSGYSEGDKVFKSTNGGSTWTNISDGLPNIPFNTIAYEAGSATDNIYLGGDIGVYFINNVTPSWLSYSNGLANAKIKDLQIFYGSSPAKLRAATYGRGTWDVNVVTNPCSVSISEVCVSGPCIFASGLYQAQNTIDYAGDYSVTNDRNVILSSGAGTTLSNGFGVLLGGVFEINTTGCTP